jgi:hypothetical protein
VKVLLKWLGVVTLVVVAVGWVLRARFHHAYLPEQGKSGTGTFGNSRYVFLDSARNELECGGKRWQGRSRSEPETVTCTGEGVSAFVIADLASQNLIVRFSPERVQGYDLAKWRGGYYRRSRP